MAKLWQLKNLESGEPLTKPQVLPENWGPVFGLSAFEDRLNNLSWMGPDHEGTGWFVVGEEPPPPKESTPEELAWDRAKQLLAQSDWAMLSDVPMSKSEKAEWIEYRRLLRNIRSNDDFPYMEWPKVPK